MQIESKRGRVPRSSHWIGENKDGKKEGERYIGLATTKVCQGCLEVFRVSELLSSIYQRLHIHS